MIYSFLEDKVDVLESHILDLAVNFINDNQAECYIFKSESEIYKLSADKSLSKIENASILDILNNKNDRETLYIINSKVDYINQDYSIVFGDDTEIYKVLKLEECDPSKRFFVFYFDKEPTTYYAFSKPTYRKRLKGNFYKYCDKNSKIHGIDAKKYGIDDDGFYSFNPPYTPERFKKFEYKPFIKDSEKIKKALKIDFTGSECGEEEYIYVVLDIICIATISLLTLFENSRNNGPVGLCLLSALSIVICLFFQLPYFFKNFFKAIGEIL